MLDLKNVIRELREEFRRAQSDLRKLDSAIAVIETTAETTGSGLANAARKHGNSKHSENPPRVFSAAARHRISQAQKVRWAKFRADKKRKAS